MVYITAINNWCKWGEGGRERESNLLLLFVLNNNKTKTLNNYYNRGKE